MEVKYGEYGYIEITQGELILQNHREIISTSLYFNFYNKSFSYKKILRISNDFEK